uniref:Ig-like domain-containing protein n=1 Tax=Pyxicephalus adspersus TaxID=30357 RepID=A0AAV2ZWX4_PYXAD|nr:TPA: hypothetical protein GDO54_014012 [Pyxicephalus adspersus]
MSGSPGESVRLTCDRSGGSVTADNYPFWYLQTPGSAPKMIVYSSSSSNQNTRPSGISDQFTGSISGGSAVLSIDRIQTDDEGVYYCTLLSGGTFTVMQKRVRQKHEMPFLNSTPEASMYFAFKVY